MEANLAFIVIYKVLFVNNIQQFSFQVSWSITQNNVIYFP